MNDKESGREREKNRERESEQERRRNEDMSERGSRQCEVGNLQDRGTPVG